MKYIKNVKYIDTENQSVLSEKENILIGSGDSVKVLNIYLKQDDGYEIFNQYNDQGLLVGEKSSNGVEAMHSYDDQGKRIYSKRIDSTDNQLLFEEWSLFNDKGLLLERKVVMDEEQSMERYKYNEWNLPIEVVTSDGVRTHVYNEKEKISYTKLIDSDAGIVREEWYEYNEEGLLSEMRNSDEDIFNYVYDTTGNLVKYYTSYGKEEYWKFNKDQQEIYFHSVEDEFEEWKEYDDQNNLIYVKNTDGQENWFTYDALGNIVEGKDNTGYSYTQKFNEHGDIISYIDSEGVNHSWIYVYFD